MLTFNLNSITYSWTDVAAKNRYLPKGRRRDGQWMAFILIQNEQCIVHLLNNTWDFDVIRYLPHYKTIVGKVTGSNPAATTMEY